ncbi:MAG: hypothetical protein KTR31_09715 [Myxococcales bacterium]|nr:hypothetical protein [Myxococcales bacterium]
MTRRSISPWSVVLAAGVAAVLLLGLGKKLDVVDPEVARRGVGFCLSMLLVVAGNVYPKWLPPPSQRTAPGPAARFDRWLGQSMVLVGGALAVLWWLLPAAALFPVAGMVGVAASGLVTTRWVSRGELPALAAPQGLLLQLFVAVGWVHAMFLADAALGDAAAQWVAIGYPLVHGVLLALAARSRAPAASS